ncbi:hypothetical protein [Pseudanabaena sp. FACHB-2040]|uniref:hypothetical protein n=1 Tax=Pseudanabaena sp. FACHB-2040 TaxID=2692859 RepID=UPI00168395DB|nr:hypothetical protein [Pseudanabaena sp. FACHB-2040]MBD2256478.1 hypothetical protein [Pseudanabaena sp. FACHB-2040]
MYRIGISLKSWGVLLAAGCLWGSAPASTWAAPEPAIEPSPSESVETPAAEASSPAEDVSAIRNTPRALPMAVTPVPVPPFPETVPEAISPDPAGLVGLHPTEEADLGIGHLRPKQVSSLQDSSWPQSPTANASWLRDVTLPIYAAPEGEPWGWFINGWLVTDQADPLAVGRDAAFSMLHTYSGLYTFPVMEVRPDGWFRFQYTPVGTAWAHVSHLNLGSVELTLETWEDRFLSAGWIEFRKHGASHALMPQPESGQSLQALISPNSLIEPLEFEGDWARVRVTQPVDACAPLPGAGTQEGWIRWRTGEQDSLVWFPPEGC